MYMLVLQTFLLMMAAFLLGCMLSCIVKRSFNRVVAADAPADLLRVEVPPPVQRTAPEPVAAPRAPVDVAPGETQRFERALTGDVAAPSSPSTAAASGPMIEVQAPPVQPAQYDVREDTSSGLAAAAAAAAAASAAAAYSSTTERSSPESDDASARDATWTRVELTPEPVSAVPAPPSFDETPEVAAGEPGDGETYNAIAVASHDGSMLPPPGVVEAVLPPPEMPQPAPPPQPVPPVDIPAAVRPDDAPDGPDPNYVAEALAAGYDYVDQPEAEPHDFALPEPTGEFDYPPSGETYASVALGGSGDPTPAAPATPVAEDAEPEPVYETKSTHVSTALAAAAGLAAERAAAGHAAGHGDDLTRIDGIDDVLAARLNYAGVTRFVEIASWNADDVRRMSQTLGFFGRIEDEYWIGQARLLAEKQDHTAAPALAAADATHDNDDYALADDTPPTVTHATPADAAGIATAAAAAAAAAMVGYASRSREEPVHEAPEPEELPQEEPAHSDEQAPADDASHEAAPPTAEATDGASPDELLFESDAGSPPRPDLAGLRSVRSEGLLGDDAEYARSSGQEDLKRIRGIGVLIEKKLNSLGISSYEQVANWSAADIERISELLDFKGRIERENWIEQARILASGGQTEFSRRVDRGEV